MSSDEGEQTSSVPPKDSGSSVSSELQDEYEELLRYAVVTPKFEGQTAASPQLLKDDARSHRPAGSNLDAEDVRHSISVRASQASPLIVEPHSFSRASSIEQMASVILPSPSERLQPASDRSRHTSPDPRVSVETEVFISEEDISKMEILLETWSNNLKSNVLTELRKWRVALIEHHKLELKKERDRCASQSAVLHTELSRLRELLHTYQTSSHRKDEVIKNLSRALDRQKEKTESMRAFTHWRLQHMEVKEEACAIQRARQHYHLQLKKKVWAGWQSLTQRHWKEQVERACRVRAEEVCVRLSTDYEAKLAELCEALEKAQAEILKMRLERERSEESMKKAFMRGVCALNMEALSMFHPAEPPEQHDAAAPPPDEPGSGSLAQIQARPVSSRHFSPVHFDPPAHPSHPIHSEPAEMVGSRTEALSSTTVVHSSLPVGGVTSTQRQASGRVVTSSQQKPSKTVTARISARPDLSKAVRGSLQVMGVTPPMSSVVVERHHPVTQLTLSQATAAKFPRSAQPKGQSSSRAPSSSHHVRSIKVVD